MALRHRLAGRLARLWWKVRRPRTLGVRAIVVDPAGRVLLVRHTYRPGWYLPGGGVDRNESMAAAAVREVVEETGVTPIAIDRVIGLYHSRREGKDDHVALFLMRADAGAAARASVTDPHEIAAVLWSAPDALPDDTSPATRRRITAWLTGAVEGEAW